MTPPAATAASILKINQRLRAAERHVARSSTMANTTLWHEAANIPLWHQRQHP